MSRNAVSKHVRQLRADGYTIEASPRKGYRLVASPDRLLPQAIAAALRTAIIGRGEIHHYPTTDSTNTRAREYARAGCPDGSLVVAEHQSSGRGRKGRSWFSPPGTGIYATLVLRPPLAPEHAPMLTLGAAVAIAEALREHAGIDAAIKWPNDVLVGGRKIAGILTEMVGDVDSVEFAALGFGLNVNLPAARVPAGIRDTATSVQIETGQPTDRLALLVHCLTAFDSVYELIRRHRLGEILSRWRELSNFVGRRVRVDTIAGRERGVVSDIGPEGALILQTDDGRHHRILSGDVTVEG